MQPEEKRAYRKLTSEFKSAYDLTESLSVLDSLVNKGLAERTINTDVICIYPRTANKYKLKL